MRELMSLAVLVGTGVSALVLMTALLTHGILVMRGRRRKYERSWPRLFSPVNCEPRDGRAHPLSTPDDANQAEGRVVLSICPRTTGAE